MNKKRIRKVTSIILAVCFFLSTVPVQALAEAIQEEMEWQKILNNIDEPEQEDGLELDSLEDSEEVDAEEVTADDHDLALTEYKTDRFIVKYKEKSPSWNQLNVESAEESAGIYTLRESIKLISPFKVVEVDVNTTGFSKNIRSAELVAEENMLLINTTEEVTLKELLDSPEVQAISKDIQYIQPDYEMEPASATSFFRELLGQQTNDLPLSLDGTSFFKELLTKPPYQTETGLDAAWEINKGEDVIVALLDTGIETTHESLRQNLLPGWDFVNDRNLVNDPEYHFDQGHGTMMAGIIAGKGDGSTENSGVAPAAKILPLKVFEEGKAYTSDIVRAIQYAEVNDAKVANVSFGSRFENPALREAVANSNMLFVCAVGNNGYNMDKYPVYPAAFGFDNVIAVSSVDTNGKLSVFSNYGEKTVDVAAPGEDVLSAWLDNTYQTGTGTSVATAYVSGEAALIFALDKYGTAKEVKERIVQSSDHISGLRDKVQEGRKINCAYAVSNRTGENTNELAVDDPPREDMVIGQMPDRDDFELYADGYVSMRTSMSTARHGLAVVAVNNKIYAIGGQTAEYGGYSNVVEEYNPATDAWTKKANMPVAKSYFGYFVYNNKVYVLGGFNGSYLSSVEVYDPVADTWVSKGNILPTARKSLTVTLDPTSGKAYAIGGYHGGYLNTVHEFDPETFTFTQKPNITTRRSDHVAFYYDGKIYVESGIAGGLDTVYTEEQYHVATGVTTNGGAPRTFMANAAGVIIEDRFIGIGGRTSGEYIEYTTEMTHSSLQDPNDELTAWYITKSQMNVARAGHGAAVLNGKVYMAGGINSNSVFAYLEELDLGWQVKSSLPIPLKNFKSIEVDGKIYVIGGTVYLSGSGQRSKAVYEYDPIKNSWSQKADMPHYGEGFSIASAYGKVYLIGGRSSASISGSYTYTNKVYEYDYKTNLWTEKASLGRFRDGAAAGFYQDKIYVIGGSYGNGLYVDVFDPLKNLWQSKKNLSSTRTSPGIHILNNQLFITNNYESNLLVYDEVNDNWQIKSPVNKYSGNLFFTLSDIIFSFSKGSNYITPSIYEYYPNENTWAYYRTFNFVGNLNEVTTLNNKAYIFVGANEYSTGLVEYSVSKTPWVERDSLGYPAAGVGAAAIGETVYAAGGYSYYGGYFNQLRVYSPSTGWENKAAMPTVRAYFGMASTGGKLYAVGGENAGTGALNKVEQYSPETNTWATMANLPNSLSHVSVVEAGGKLYAIGGRTSSGYVVNTIYEYHPATNSWAAKASMPTARYGVSAGVIGDKIYVAGGFRSTLTNWTPVLEANPTDVLEVYDITSNTWSTKKSLPYSFGYAGGAARDSFYVVGGYDGYNEFSLVYEYSPTLDKWLTWPGPQGKSYSFGTALTSEGLYAIAGKNNSGYISGIEFAPISMLTSDYIHLGEEKINPTGNFARTYTDLEYTTPGFNVMFTRTYNSADKRASSISTGWTFGFESKITEEGNIAVVRLPDGSGVTFGVNASDGSYKAKDSRSTLIKQSDSSKILTTPDQYSYGFDVKGYMVWMKDRNGNRIDITVNANGQVTAVQDPSGKISTVAYTSNRISQMTDPVGRTVKYAYDSAGRLVTVTNPSGFSHSYEYDGSGYLAKTKDEASIATETITYYPLNADETIPKVKTITDIYGNVQTYVYDKVEGKVAVMDSNNRESITWFDKMLYPIRTRDAENKETRTSYFEEGGINRYGEVYSFTDRAGNSTYFDRDDRGNIIRQLNPDETVKEFTYDMKNNLLSEKDEEGKMTFYVYDMNGVDLLKTAQPLNGIDVYTDAAPQGQFAITENSFYTTAEAQSMCGKEIAGLLKSIKDPEGNVASYTYDTNGYIATEKDGLGQVTFYQHNPIGWLNQETGVAGYTTKYYYDKLGHVTKKIDHGGETERDVYDNRGNIVQKISPNQYDVAGDPSVYDAYHILTTANLYNASAHGYRYTYLPNNLLQKEIDPLDFETSYTYDQYGNVLTETLPNGLETINSYDVLHRLKTTSLKEEPSSAILFTDEYNYVLKSDGQTEKVHVKHLNETDVAVTKETIDYAGRTVRTDNPDGGFSTNEYAGNGNLVKATDPRGNSTYYHYDGLNRPIAVWLPADSGLYMYRGTEYDKSGNITKEVQAKDNLSTFHVPTSNLVWTAFSYDARGRKVVDLDSMGGKTTYTYSDLDDTMMQRTYRDETNYDQILKKYNHLGEIKENITFVDPADFSSGTSELKDAYTFDKEGNVLTHTRPNEAAITYTYDLLGRQLTSSQPGLDENNVATNIIDTYTYDFRGAMLTEKDALGRVTRYEYDQRGNQLAKIDPNYGGTFYTYDLANRKIEELTPSNSTYYDPTKSNRRIIEYDACNQVIFQRDIPAKAYDDSTNIVNSFTYDLNGNKLTATDGMGGITTYTYDAANRVTSVCDPENAARGFGFTTQFRYNGLGQKIEEKDANNVVTNFKYNDHGNLIATSIDGQLIGSSTYDLAGNIIIEKDGNGNVVVYSYNHIDQVREVVFPGDDSIAAYTVAYQYTQLGRVARSETSLGKVNAFTYDHQGRILSETEMKSDEAEKITRSFRYDLLGNLRFEVDERGNTSEYVYDKTNRKIEDKVVVSINGEKVIKSTETKYGEAGNVLSVTDWRGNVYTNTYDHLGRITVRKDPKNNFIETFVYNDNHQQIASFDAHKGMRKFEYDRAGRVTSMTDAEGIQISQSYDAVGNKVTETDGRGNTTSYFYDAQRRLTKISNALGEDTVYTYDQAGNLLTQIDGNGNQSSFTYNVRNLLTMRVDAGEGENKAEKYTYFPNGLLLEKTDRRGTSHHYAYDIHERKTEDNAGGDLVSYTYDNSGNLLTMSDSTGVTSRTYDELGRTISKTVPSIGTTLYAYDQTAGLTKGFSAETTTDPKGNTTTKITNQVGQLYQVKNENIEIATYYYNGNGSCRSVSYHGGAREEYTYYANNLLKTITNEIHGRTIDAYRYGYDQNGNIQTKFDKKGSTTYTYDSLNRLIEVNEPSGKVTKYGFDQGGNRSTETITEGKDVTISSYAYNEQNRLVAVEKNLNDEHTGGVSYYYDANGNMISSVPYSVQDESGEGKAENVLLPSVLEQVEMQESSIADEEEKGLEADGRDKNTKLDMETNRDLPQKESMVKEDEDGLNDVPNLLPETMKNDRMSIPLPLKDADVLKSMNGYAKKDDASETGEFEVETDREKIEEFNLVDDGREDVIDDRHNLLQEGKNQEILPSLGEEKVFMEENTQTEEFSLQNVVKERETGVSLFLLGEEAIPESPTLYAYDNRNNLIKVKQGANITLSMYNGDGLRVEKKVNGKTYQYLYEYDNIILEVDGNGQETARNTYGLNLLKRSAEGESFMYMYNGHGDVTALLNQSGQVAVEYYYDAFGVIVEETAKVNNPFRYAGYEYDAESGLYYLKARHYDPTIARFLQEDTYRGQVNDPLSLNLYTYCNNEPMMYDDPTGHSLVSSIKKVVKTVKSIISSSGSKSSSSKSSGSSSSSSIISQVASLTARVKQNYQSILKQKESSAMGKSSSTVASTHKFTIFGDKDTNSILNRGLLIASLNSTAIMNKGADIVAESKLYTDKVQRSQFLLSNMGFDVYDKKPDGKMGVKTSSAVILVQSYAGIKITGRVDDQLLTKLEEYTSQGVHRLTILGKNWKTKDWENTPAIKQDNGQYTGELTRLPVNDGRDAFAQPVVAIAWARLVQGAMDYNETASSTKQIDIGKFALTGSDAGYRPYHQQVEAWFSHYADFGNMAAIPKFEDEKKAEQWAKENKSNVKDKSWNNIPDEVTGPGGALAGAGTSPHGFGAALDLSTGDPGSNGKGKGYATTEIIKWLEKNSSTYGFSPYGKVTGTGKVLYEETWHWNYVMK